LFDDAAGDEAAVGVEGELAGEKEQVTRARRGSRSRRARGDGAR
jgi:hypothetical protein